MIKKLQILLFIIYFGQSLCAQEVNQQNNLQPDGLEITLQDGIIMPHNETIDYLTQETINSFSFHFIYNNNNNSLWKRIYHKPRFGFGVNYSTLGNRKIFGDAYSIYPFFEAPIWTVQDRLRFHYRISYGLSYITETYDLYNNYKNISISSHLNIYFNLMLNAEVKLFEKTNLFIAAGLTHFSNGKVKAPNKGLNTITSSFGIRHYFNEHAFEKKETIDLPDIKERNRLSVIWSHGMKEHSRFIDGFFYISSLNISYERKYKHWAQVNLGLDGFYDKSLRVRIEGDPRDKFPESQLFRLGAHLGHDFLVGNVALTVQLGHYFYNKRFFITDFYNRIGLKYYFNDRFILNMSLKSHNANAEFIEFGLGYFWN